MTQTMSGYANNTIYAVPAMQRRLIGYALLETGCDPLSLLEYIRMIGIHRFIIMSRKLGLITYQMYQTKERV